MRIGSDVANFWGREGNADGPSLRNATRATLARLWLHGRWWINDPDCVVIRAHDTQLSLAEVQGWASVVALSGGMVFVGDDVSRVDESRLALLARLAEGTWGPTIIGPENRSKELPSRVIGGNLGGFSGGPDQSRKKGLASSSASDRPILGLIGGKTPYCLAGADASVRAAAQLLRAASPAVHG